MLQDILQWHNITNGVEFVVKATFVWEETFPASSRGRQILNKADTTLEFRLSNAEAEPLLQTQYRFKSKSFYIHSLQG